MVTLLFSDVEKKRFGYLLPSIKFRLSLYLKLKFGRFFVRILKRFKSSDDLNFTKPNLICFLARKLRDSNE